MKADGAAAYLPVDTESGRVLTGDKIPVQGLMGVADCGMIVVSKDGFVIAKNAFVGQSDVAGSVYDAGRMGKVVRLPVEDTKRNINTQVLVPASNAIDENLFTATQVLWEHLE
jgi:hypothetical protein